MPKPGLRHSCPAVFASLSEKLHSDPLLCYIDPPLTVRAQIGDLHALYRFAVVAGTKFGQLRTHLNLVSMQSHFGVRICCAKPGLCKQYSCEQYFN